MRKYQKMGCVRYAANDAKAAELESMGYTECTCPKKAAVDQVSKQTIEDVIKEALKNIDNRQAEEENTSEDTTETENTEEQEKADIKPETKRKSGKKGKADTEASAADPASGGDDDGSDPTDNK